MASQKYLLFEDIFHIRALNENGKMFERVNRLHCKGTTFEVDLVLDVNSELFDVKAGERVAIVLASTLDLSGASDGGTYNPSTGRSLADNYDYVMHGRVFEIKHIDALRIEIQASFGGLLLRAIGDQAQFDNIVYDMNFFILMRKGGSDSSMITD